MNKDVSTSLSQERSCPSSTQLTINKGQQQNIQLTDEETQTGQDDTTLPSPETTLQNESAMLEHEISTKGKRMPGVKATTIDEFLKENGIDVEIEGPSTELSEDGEESMALDKDYYQHVMEDIDDEEGEPKKKKTRGKTTCKEIYARTMEQQEEITFDLGQPVGPTDQSVSNLTSFVGTIGRNKRFVSLLYTSWHAVPPKAKKFMWDYVNTKFFLPDSGEKWVIQAIRDAWKRFKRKIKQKHFVPYDNIEDMVKNRPPQVPESGAPMKISKYDLILQRATKETKEEPKRFEMFIATRTSRKRKEVDEETQMAVEDFQHRQAAGETEEEAFEALFGKEQPGRIRLYGRSVTKTDLKKYVEINEIKNQHKEEVSSLKDKLRHMEAQQQKQEAKQQKQDEEIHGLRNMIKLLLQRSEPGMRPEELEALLQDAQQSPIDANSGHGSTHFPNLDVDNNED
ncbi:uncharacterized protein LOC130949978 [Arachis stenosperma]|uniref:uncharacterized protein LOC130949978 n=1 Tax=Arachis stenosperma TaxID=217475 RepID=UPI0025AD7089|nr:uncharacterized protein LOC130949978 [Arachis stenosperma]